MSNNNPLFPPTGNNNNQKRKRAHLPSASSTGESDEQNKRPRNAPHPASTPSTGPPAQPSSGFRNPQMAANSAAYASMNTPCTGSQPGDPSYMMGSTSSVPHYSQMQAQPLWPQPPPQHALQPAGFRPGSLVQPTSASPRMDVSAVQQQVATQGLRGRQGADSSTQQAQQRSKKTKLFTADEVQFHDAVEGVPGDITIQSRPCKNSFISETSNPNMTIVSAEGPRILKVLEDQGRHFLRVHGGNVRIVSSIRSVPLITGSRPTRQLSEASESNQPLISTKRGGGRQKPGTASLATVPVPAPAPEPAPCQNCGRNDHRVGDCVGPSNPVHGDLPACPICNTFADRTKTANNAAEHQFDDCPQVQIVLDNLGWHKDCRFEYEDLAGLTSEKICLLFNNLVAKRSRKVPIRTTLFCWFDVLRETVRRFPKVDVSGKLKNMTPWTKTFAIQQHNLSHGLTKPWDRFNYAARNLSELPEDPIEQIWINSKEITIRGLPDFQPQIFLPSDSERRAKNLEVEQESEHIREERRSLTTDRDSREVEVVGDDNVVREDQRADALAERSNWQTTLNCVFQYLADLNPVSSDSYGTGYKGVDQERLMRPLTYFLSREKKRDRFTAFLEDLLKPDGWYCVGQICSSHHSGFEPIDGKCVRVHEYSECSLQVRHLDAHLGGRTLDFRIEASDGDGHDGEEE